MGKRGAMLADGTALLDTGIFVVRGDAFSNLVAFALLDPNPVADILATGEEVGGLPLFATIFPLSATGTVLLNELSCN